VSSKLVKKLHNAEKRRRTLQRGYLFTPIKHVQDSRKLSPRKGGNAGNCNNLKHYLLSGDNRDGKEEDKGMQKDHQQIKQPGGGKQTADSDKGNVVTSGLGERLILTELEQVVKEIQHQCGPGSDHLVRDFLDTGVQHVPIKSPWSEEG